MILDIHYTSTDGLSLYAKQHGPTNAPLTTLCMHGLTRNHKDFEPMISSLHAAGLNIRFLAVDVRGRARSARDTNTENYTPATYAGDMVTLLDHLSIQKTVLIGTSMGGLMSMILMSLIPERILGVVLNDIGPELDPRGLDRIAGYVGGNTTQPDWDAAGKAVAAVQSVAFPDYTHEDWVAFARRTYCLREDGRLELDYDPAIGRTVRDVRPTPETNAAMWQLFKGMSSRPLLLIRGELSDLLSAHTAEKMITGHGHAALVTVPRVGHAPLLDEPVVTTALARFLTSLETQI
jgi:pimeloyl-ACP methyl ester carboxylesterase